MRIYACPRQSGRSGVEHRRKPVDTFKWNLETSCLICTSTRGGAALKLFMKTLAPGDLTMTRRQLCCMTMMKICRFLHRFTQRVVLNGKVYPEAVGKTKKKAKQNAAENALNSLLSNKPVCEETRSQSVNSKDNSFASFTDVRARVNNYCQKNNVSHYYISVKRCGQPHIPQFFYKLVIDDKEYPVGEGKTVKEAKQNAAQLAWPALQGQSNHPPPMLSSPSTSLDSSESSQQSVPMSRSDSIVFTDSSNPLKSQASLSSAVSENDAPASLSPPSTQESVEPSSLSMVAVKNKSMGNSVSNTSTQSRFTSEFDSISCLGYGGFGHVYKAREKLLDKYYAVKVVHDREKALREVLALSDLHHHNIVRYYNCWREETEYEHDSRSTSQWSVSKSSQYLYIKMELCDTKTLKGWINERNETTPQESKRRVESVTIAQQIVNGVEYIHAKKLIHRDLKPANVMFGRDGEVKIGDFGLVTAEADDENKMERTIETGTLSYMAPEQKSEKTYDGKVDIFAFGLIYFELLLKVSSGHERAEFFRDARSQKFPKEFTFPQEKLIIKPTLCERPEHRPEAKTLKEELEKWAQALKEPKNKHQQNVTV
ncbi:interferon-induced, double-stranded RNA-activated protein kinase isoform X2 [Scophthalmus maximus]|uniref:interferon-induced, double-stranded RNA-activated protein kinase isoform X2 n=1 Tax=Scophthalmus maximus TaxID=52904 RepID=UPI001FA93834|nr:interferon-induced, double-stranded RNA-activated protein kinase isoform X2 [Scophthalmus maximus]